jgi:hypothetical protein
MRLEQVSPTSWAYSILADSTSKKWSGVWGRTAIPANC